MQVPGGGFWGMKSQSQTPDVYGAEVIPASTLGENSCPCRAPEVQKLLPEHPEEPLGWFLISLHFFAADFQSALHLLLLSHPFSPRYLRSKQQAGLQYHGSSQQCHRHHGSLKVRVKPGVSPQLSQHTGG